MNAVRGDRFPLPPAGYQPAERFQYPKIKLQIAALVVLALVTPSLLALVWVLQRPSAESPLVLVSGGIDLLPIVGTVLATTTVHELVHGAAYRLLGYRVTFGVSGHLLAAYAAAFDQWQTRNHNLIVALAPLVALTGILLPMLAVESRVVVLVAVTALMMNTAGAVGDLYLAWRLLRMPRATLLYDIDVKTMLIYRHGVESVE
jgi:hypothetical protein